MITSSSSLKVTYPRQNLTPIMIHVLIECYMSPCN